MNTSNEDKSCKVRVIEKCWGYLFENFHKFTDNNKIKVALALCTKDIPQEIKGDAVFKNYTIIKNSKAEVEDRNRIGETESIKLPTA